MRRCRACRVVVEGGSRRWGEPPGTASGDLSRSPFRTSSRGRATPQWTPCRARCARHQAGGRARAGDDRAAGRRGRPGAAWRLRVSRSGPHPRIRHHRELLGAHRAGLGGCGETVRAAERRGGRAVGHARLVPMGPGRPTVSGEPPCASPGRTPGLRSAIGPLGPGQPTPRRGRWRPGRRGCGCGRRR